MRKIGITNNKGGVAKTMTTTMLAAALAKRGKRVLAVDLDGQCNLSSNLNVLVKDDDARLIQVFLGQEKPLVVESSIPGVDLIPGSRHMANLDLMLASEMGRETRLRKNLKFDDELWDFLLVDCPPSTGLTTVNALNAVDELIIPVETASEALESFLIFYNNWLPNIKDACEIEFEVIAVVPTKKDHNTKMSSNGS